MTDHNPTPCETPEMQNRAVEVPDENPSGVSPSYYVSPCFTHSYQDRREAERRHEYERVRLNLPEETGKPDDYSVTEQAKTERMLAYMMIVFAVCLLAACLIFGAVMANRADQRGKADQKAAERAMEPVSVPQLGVPQSQR